MFSIHLRANSRSSNEGLEGYICVGLGLSTELWELIDEAELTRDFASLNKLAKKRFLKQCSISRHRYIQILLIVVVVNT